MAKPILFYRLDVGLDRKLNVLGSHIMSKQEVSLQLNCIFGLDHNSVLHDEAISTKRQASQK